MQVYTRDQQITTCKGIVMGRLRSVQRGREVQVRGVGGMHRLHASSNRVHAHFRVHRVGGEGVDWMHGLLAWRVGALSAYMAHGCG